MLPAALLAFLALLQEAAPMPSSSPTGLEWMVVASVVVPAVLLAVLIYLGSKTTVRR